MYLNPMFLERRGLAGYSEDLERAITPAYQSPIVLLGVGVGALLARRTLVGAAVGGGIGLAMRAGILAALRAAARRADAMTAAGAAGASAQPGGLP